MPTKTLVCLSGGLDSTYVLWKTLSTTDDEITAVFFDASHVTESGSGSIAASKAERAYNASLSPYYQKAARNVVNWCSSNIRPVTFLVKNFKNMAESDSVFTHMIKSCASMINSGEYDRLLMGMGPAIVNEPSSHNTPKLTSENGVYQKAFNGVSGRGTIEYPIKQTNANALVIIQNLPTALYDLTLSCRTPKIDEAGNHTECGTCRKCIWKYMIKYKIAEGVVNANTFVAWHDNNKVSNTSITFTYNGNEYTYYHTTPARERISYSAFGGIWEGSIYETAEELEKKKKALNLS